MSVRKLSPACNPPLTRVLRGSNGTPRSFPMKHPYKHIYGVCTQFIEVLIDAPN